MKQGQRVDVAVLGAAGAAGEVVLDILARRGFPVRRLYPLGTGGEVGEAIAFGKDTPAVLDAAVFDWRQVQLAFFVADDQAATTYASMAAAAGCMVIGGAGGFREDREIPLVVPEVNPHAMMDIGKRRLLAGPSCAAIQLSLVLKPIHDAVGIRRVHAVVYQPVSGAGQAAVDELAEQTRALFTQRAIESRVYPQRIAFNLIPQVGALQDDGYTHEETALMHETRRVLDDDALALNVTAAWMPLFYGQAIAVHLETRRKITAAEAGVLLAKAPGVAMMDARAGVPTLLDAVGQDSVCVGRLREDVSCATGLSLWAVMDNLRKGAALNSVQIAEHLLANGLE